MVTSFLAVFNLCIVLMCRIRYVLTSQDRLTIRAVPIESTLQLFPSLQQFLGHQHVMASSLPNRRTDPAISGSSAYTHRRPEEGCPCFESGNPVWWIHSFIRHSRRLSMTFQRRIAVDVADFMGTKSYLVLKKSSHSATLETG